MLEVYFRNSHGKEYLLTTAKTNKEARKAIYDFLKERNFKTYYWRWWKEANGDWICDVGSWSEFFIVRGADKSFIEGE